MGATHSKRSLNSSDTLMDKQGTVRRSGGLKGKSMLPKKNVSSGSENIPPKYKLGMRSGSTDSSVPRLTDQDTCSSTSNSRRRFTLETAKRLSAGVKRPNNKFTGIKKVVSKKNESIKCNSSSDKRTSCLNRSTDISSNQKRTTCKLSQASRKVRSSGGGCSATVSPFDSPLKVNTNIIILESGESSDSINSILSNTNLKGDCTEEFNLLNSKADFSVIDDSNCSDFSDRSSFCCSQSPQSRNNSMKTPISQHDSIQSPESALSDHTSISMASSGVTSSAARIRAQAGELPQPQVAAFAKKAPKSNLPTRASVSGSITHSSNIYNRNISVCPVTFKAANKNPVWKPSTAYKTHSDLTVSATPHTATSKHATSSSVPSKAFCKSTKLNSPQRRASKTTMKQVLATAANAAYANDADLNLISHKAINKGSTSNPELFGATNKNEVANPLKFTTTNKDSARNPESHTATNKDTDSNIAPCSVSYKDAGWNPLSSNATNKGTVSNPNHMFANLKPSGHYSAFKVDSKLRNLVACSDSGVGSSLEGGNSAIIADKINSVNQNHVEPGKLCPSDVKLPEAIDVKSNSMADSFEDESDKWLREKKMNMGQTCRLQSGSLLKPIDLFRGESQAQVSRNPVCKLNRTVYEGQSFGCLKSPHSIIRETVSLPVKCKDSPDTHNNVKSNIFGPTSLIKSPIILTPTSSETVEICLPVTLEYNEAESNSRKQLRQRKQETQNAPLFDNDKTDSFSPIMNCSPFHTHISSTSPCEISSISKLNPEFVIRSSESESSFEVLDSTSDASDYSEHSPADGVPDDKTNQTDSAIGRLTSSLEQSSIVDSLADSIVCESDLCSSNSLTFVNNCDNLPKDNKFLYLCNNSESSHLNADVLHCSADKTVQLRHRPRCNSTAYDHNLNVDSSDTDMSLESSTEDCKALSRTANRKACLNLSPVKVTTMNTVPTPLSTESYKSSEQFVDDFDFSELFTNGNSFEQRRSLDNSRHSGGGEVDQDFLIDDEICDQPELTLARDDDLHSSHMGNSLRQHPVERRTFSDEDELFGRRICQSTFEPILAKMHERPDSAGSVSFNEDDCILDFESDDSRSASPRHRRGIVSLEAESSAHCVSPNLSASPMSLTTHSSSPGRIKPTRLPIRCDRPVIDATVQQQLLQDCHAARSLLQQLHDVLICTDSTSFLQGPRKRLESQNCEQETRTSSIQRQNECLLKQVKKLQQELMQRDQLIEKLLYSDMNSVKQKESRDVRSDRQNAATQTDRGRPLSSTFDELNGPTVSCELDVSDDKSGTSAEDEEMTVVRAALKNGDTSLKNATVSNASCFEEEHAAVCSQSSVMLTAPVHVVSAPVDAVTRLVGNKSLEEVSSCFNFHERRLFFLQTTNSVSVPVPNFANLRHY